MSVKIPPSAPRAVEGISASKQDTAKQNGIKTNALDLSGFPDVEKANIINVKTTYTVHFKAILSRGGRWTLALFFIALSLSVEVHYNIYRFKV